MEIRTVGVKYWSSVLVVFSYFLNISGFMHSADWKKQGNGSREVVLGRKKITIWEERRSSQSLVTQLIGQKYGAMAPA